MFNPEDWTRLASTDTDMRTIYINEDTGLPKLRETFSREQQRMLDRHEQKALRAWNEVKRIK